MSENFDNIKKKQNIKDFLKILFGSLLAVIIMSALSITGHCTEVTISENPPDLPANTDVAFCFASNTYHDLNANVNYTSQGTVYIYYYYTQGSTCPTYTGSVNAYNHYYITMSSACQGYLVYSSSGVLLFEWQGAPTSYGFVNNNYTYGYNYTDVEGVQSNGLTWTTNSTHIASFMEPKIYLARLGDTGYLYIGYFSNDNIDIAYTVQQYTTSSSSWSVSATGTLEEAIYNYDVLDYDAILECVTLNDLDATSLIRVRWQFTVDSVAYTQYSYLKVSDNLVTRFADGLQSIYTSFSGGGGGHSFGVGNQKVYNTISPDVDDPDELGDDYVTISTTTTDDDDNEVTTYTYVPVTTTKATSVYTENDYTYNEWVTYMGDTVYESISNDSYYYDNSNTSTTINYNYYGGSSDTKSGLWSTLKSLLEGLVDTGFLKTTAVSESVLGAVTAGIGTFCSLVICAFIIKAVF